MGNRYFYRLTFLMVFACTLFSCGNKKEAPESINPAFREYISAYTAGTISRKDGIRIRLVNPVEDGESKKTKEKIKDSGSPP